MLYEYFTDKIGDSAFGLIKTKLLGVTIGSKQCESWRLECDMFHSGGFDGGTCP